MSAPIAQREISIARAYKAIKMLLGMLWNTLATALEPPENTPRHALAIAFAYPDDIPLEHSIYLMSGCCLRPSEGSLTEVPPPEALHVQRKQGLR